MSSDEHKMNPLNHPFDEVCKGAEEQTKAGHTVYQKFTCGGCRARLMIEQPNVFFTTGTCDFCGYLTDIRKDGCNYLLVVRKPKP